MIVGLIKENVISQTILPNKIVGNYWIKDIVNNEDRKIINIEALNGKWCLLSNSKYTIVENNKEKEHTYLKDYSFCLIKDKMNNKYILLYCSPIYDTTYKKYNINTINDIVIGNNNDNHIYYSNFGIDKIHARIVFNNNKYILLDNNSRLGAYVNNKRIQKKKSLSNGDVIFIGGLKIILCIENDNKYIYVNNPNNLVKCRLNEQNVNYTNIDTLININEEDTIVDLNTNYNRDYIYNKFRQEKNNINTNIEIKNQEKNNNLVSLQIIYGPMITILIVSIMILFISIYYSLFIGIIISIIVIISLLFWPLIIKKYNNNKLNEDNDKYRKYLDEKKGIISAKIDEQKSIINDNSFTFLRCQDIVLKDNELLWCRKSIDKDFLDIVLGTSDIKSNIGVKHDDTITYAELNNVPFIINLKSINTLGIIGKNKLIKMYLRQIIIQLATLHRYDELKIVMLTNDKYKDEYKYLKILPHCFSNNKEIRFFATNDYEIKQVGSYILNQLKNNDNCSHYVVFINSINDLYKYEFINKISKYEKCIIIIMDNSINSSIEQCEKIICIEEDNSLYYENKLNGFNQNFIVDFENQVDINKCFSILANTYIDIRNNKLPNRYSLLQMYKVNLVEQLNSYNRWNYNNSELSLKTRIGIDIYGNDILLDLHKDYDGTHTLIEGIPGSGKTEFIISYILSMSINYSPKDVQFLILCNNNKLYDTFNNRLEHVTGTILYDSYELKRFITSFKAELVNRQKYFIKIAQKYNQDDMDIYKYQQLYHSGLVKKYIPHLFIIIDEYEQLENNYPSFINNILKISHIGPTLGIHYVFTSNKTEITKNIDIFNSKILMYNINNIDNIVNHPGQFYLKNRDNEITLGMSANGEYIYRINDIIDMDASVEFINNIGQIIKKKDKFIKYDKLDIVNTETNNIINYLNKICESENIQVNDILLNKLDDYNTVASLIDKYQYNIVKYSFKPVIGEYENLINHTHNILTLDLNDHSIIYSVLENEYEMFINSILFSSMYLYTTQELNYYIIDLDSNNLAVFKNNPLVMDIIADNQNDKVRNLFKLIDVQIEQRKKMFKEYNGYTEYVTNTNNMIPIMVVIINNFEKFSINYSKYVDNIISILSSNNYGISFIFTNSNIMANKVFNKINQKYILKQSSNDDYDVIFNQRINVYPDNYLGRGLCIQNDTICEFQTAYVNPKNKDFKEFVIEQCNECSKEYNENKFNIQILPDILTFKHVKHEIGKTNEMIIGYNNDLKLIKYNFDDKNINIISGINMNIISKFVNPLIKQYAYLNRNDVVVIDCNKDNLIKDINNLDYIDSKFDKNIDMLYEYVERIYNSDEDNNNGLKHKTIFINGFDKFYTKISNKEKFIDLINKIKKISIINIIIIDDYRAIKKYYNELWLKEIVEKSDSIWVGKDILKQDVIVAKSILDNDINDNYCYLIEYGIPVLIQYVENFDVLEK